MTRCELARVTGLTPCKPRCSVRFNIYPWQSPETKEAVMFRKAIWAFAAAVCLAIPVAVRAQGEYLDVVLVKVKPEKLADFQAISKKWVDANRRFNGDHWLAPEKMYGEGGGFFFWRPRQDYADIEKLSEVG